MPFSIIKSYQLPILIKKHQHVIYGICLFIFLCLIWPALGMAQDAKIADNAAPATVSAAAPDTTAAEAENTDVTQALEDLLKGMKLGNFVYQVDERPDPFMPFISEKVVQPSDTDSENGERLTGMRQFEPGQLILVAIMFTETNPMAMVEDSSHKGYLIHRGTKIGKTGVVTDILPNEVVIKQLSYSMDQVKKYSTMEMILRKEGEK